MLGSFAMRGMLVGLAIWGAALAVAPAAADPTPYAPAAAGTRAVYRHATLIDGTGAAPRADMAVVTNGERIEAVLPDASLTPAQLQGAHVVDLSGRWLLPGLIDSHQHMATPPDPTRARAWLRRDIFSGITATRIMADDLRSIAELNREAYTGEIPAPDLAFAAVMAGPSFFADPRTHAISAGWTPGETPWAQSIDDGTDIPLAVARAKGTGATAIKIYANLPARLVAAIAAEAHRQGMKVWTHAMVFPATPEEVIAAGPDTMSHSCYLAYQLSDPPPQSYQDRFPVNYPAFAHGDNPVMTRIFDEMRQRHIILDATLNVYAETDRRAAMPGGRPYHCNLDLAGRLTDQARRQGVTISAGTDGDTPADAPYPALFNELELLVQRAGMTPIQAIHSATEVGAMAMGEADLRGTVQPGRLADLVILSRDPNADIANMRSVVLTVKRGHTFARADYVPITRDEVGNDD
jgi:hypothetical protein